MRGAVARRVDKAKRAGRTTAKYAFSVDVLSATGLPERIAGTGIVVQCARGPKISQTEEAEAPGGMLPGGCIEWAAQQQLSFVSTLYASKTGKAFSDKRFRVTVYVAKPAFGTSKKTLSELAHGELNVSDFASAEARQHVLSLPLKQTPWRQIELIISIGATCIKAAPRGDSDEEGSISSALTGFSREGGASREGSSREGSSCGAAKLEQDLDGFVDDAPTNPWARRGAPSAGGGYAASVDAARAPAACAAVEGGAPSASEWRAPAPARDGACACAAAGTSAGDGLARSDEVDELRREVATLRARLADAERELARHRAGGDAGGGTGKPSRWRRGRGGADEGAPAADGAEGGARAAALARDNAALLAQVRAWPLVLRVRASDVCTPPCAPLARR